MYINEIFEIDKILNEEKRILQKKSMEITNISYWNASKYYQEYMIKNIRLVDTLNIFDYIYTYDIDKSIRKKILQKLGIADTEHCMCLLTPSSTISITNIVNFLKLNNYKKICIIEPSYFSVEQSCIAFNFRYEKASLVYNNGCYIIPEKYILENNFDAVWITSPVYSAGVALDVGQIKKLIDAKILVIADETLSLPGQELCRIIPINQYFFSIYSPHKALFINNIKFSMIVCPVANDDFFEQWIDVLGGGLLHSNVMAISHYLSDNFEDCTNKCIEWYEKNLHIIDYTLKSFDKVECNTNQVGAYKMIYLDSNDNISFNSTQEIINIMNEDYVSYIPGIYNGHSCIKNNSFRVNLSYNPYQVQNALFRILNHYL